MIDDPIVWRCISYKGMSGGMNWFRQTVMFDDYVTAPRFQEYMKTIEERGVEKVTIKKLGTLSSWLQKGLNPIRAGAERISYEKKNHKLEDYGLVTKEEGKVCSSCGKPSLVDRCKECSDKLDERVGIIK